MGYSKCLPTEASIRAAAISIVCIHCVRMYAVTLQECNLIGMCTHQASIKHTHTMN